MKRCLNGECSAASQSRRHREDAARLVRVEARSAASRATSTFTTGSLFVQGADTLVRGSGRDGVQLVLIVRTFSDKNMKKMNDYIQYHLGLETDCLPVLTARISASLLTAVFLCEAEGSIFLKIVVTCAGDAVVIMI